MPTQVTATLEDVYRWDNLYTAYRKAAKGKRGQRLSAAFEFLRSRNPVSVCAANAREP